MGVHAGPKDSLETGVVKDGLVFWVNAADEASYPGLGTTWTDVVGGATGTLTNGPVYDRSLPGVSFNFDGSNDQVEFADSDTFSFGDASNDSAFSVDAWINAVDMTRFRVLQKANEWLMGPFGDDKLGLTLIDNNNSNYIYRTTHQTVQAHTGADQNQWISVTSTYDGGGANTGIKHYINGTETDLYINGAAGSYTAMHNQSSVLNIGTNADFGSFANGEIASVRLYNKVLTSDEVATNYRIEKKRYGR